MSRRKELDLDGMAAAIRREAAGRKPGDIRDIAEALEELALDLRSDAVKIEAGDVTHGDDEVVEDDE